MQDHDHPGVDLTPLLQSFADSFADEVPMIAKALGALIVGAIGFVGRHFALVAAVKREAVAAERAIGGGSGKQKHKRVRTRIKETWPMSRVKKIDSLIKTRGKAAADKDRKYRESQIPPPPLPPSESN
jgi:hypothetical protein